MAGLALPPHRAGVRDGGDPGQERGREHVAAWHGLIVAPGWLGVGDMGEVYRATDTDVDRQVAIKVPPASVAQDPERLARFDREAKTLAALNHPNIAVI